jgi:alpha-tubulin suppressor-like RCC1 family protein
MAWGLNDYGQLGNGGTTSSARPVAVRGLTGVTAIVSAGEHSLAKT